MPMAQKISNQRIALAEFLGSIILLMTIVGAGIMADNVSDDDGVSMFITVTSIAFSLALIIKIFSPISGGHFNPLVTFYFYFLKEVKAKTAFIMVISQLSGALVGTVLANLMFDLPAISISKLDRLGSDIFIAELVATIGLFIVLQLITSNKNLNPAVIIPIYIGPAIFYTSSTAFVNPSITLTRTLSDTFTGISPASVPLFLLAQFLGAIIGMIISKGLIDSKK
jgi:glycerol uptake facilitator-like aquaporin